MQSASTRCSLSAFRSRRKTPLSSLLLIFAILAAPSQAQDADLRYEAGTGVAGWKILGDGLPPDLLPVFRAVNRFAVADAQDRLTSLLMSDGPNANRSPYNPYERFDGLTIDEIIRRVRTDALAYHHRLMAELFSRINACTECSELRQWQLFDQQRNIAEDRRALELYTVREYLD